MTDPTTIEDLQQMLPRAAIEQVGDREEVVIYTGWTSDEEGRLLPMSDD